MRTDNQDFHNILTKTDFADISHFWEVPYKDILEEAKAMPLSYWRKPFDADYKREGLNDLESNVYYPGSKGDLIPAKGWRSVTVLNETGDHRDQISRFTPIFKTQNEYRNKVKEVIENSQWTNVAKYYPKLQKFFIEEIFPYMHVGHIYVSVLDAGGIVTEHNDIPDEARPMLDSDRIHSFNVLNTFNLVLNHVKSCYSCFNGKIMPAYDGAIRWTNTGKQHWVVNMNKESQYQIIWQGLYKKEFRKLVKEKYKYSHGSYQ
tara:strand:- start:103 stop:885 length:783 start_codon:yes stop_codon:yes gene_type:complete